MDVFQDPPRIVYILHSLQISAGAGMSGIHKVLRPSICDFFHLSSAVSPSPRVSPGSPPQVVCPRGPKVAFSAPPIRRGGPFLMFFGSGTMLAAGYVLPAIRAELQAMRRKLPESPDIFL